LHILITVMKQKMTAGNSGSGRNRGGLLLLLAAGVTLFLSVTVLYRFVSTMFTGQDRMEQDFRLSLARASAADYAGHMYRSGLADPGSDLDPIASGQFVSSFNTLNARFVESVDHHANTFPAGTAASAASSPGGVFLGAVPGDSLVIVKRGNCRDFQRVDERINLCLAPETWFLEGASPSLDPVCFAVCSYASVSGLFSIFEDGSYRAYSLGDFSVSSGSRLTSGLVQGNPCALITDGGNRGLLLDLENGDLSYISSTPGTCPAVMPDGRVYGSPGPRGYEEEGSSAVSDLFFLDIDLDGVTDAAWVTENSLACTSSALDSLMVDRSDSASLTAWGYLGGRYGLGGLWSRADGTVSWRKFTFAGFSPVLHETVFTENFTGRIVQQHDLYLAIEPRGVTVLDKWGVALLREENAVAADFDGSGTVDLLILGEDGETLRLDPTSPGSVILTLEVSTVDSRSELTDSFIMEVESRNSVSDRPVKAGV